MTDIHSCSYYCDRPECVKAQRDELRDKLAQPEQEPCQYAIDVGMPEHRCVGKCQYAAQRTWVGLTDDERNKLWRDVVKWGDPSHDDVDLMKAIEAKLKEKNT